MTYLFDDSALGKIILRGPDAPMFLGNLSTNDIKSLPLGGGCPTYFCDARAKALFQATVYHIRTDDAPNALWLESSTGREAALFQHLDRYLISEAVELENVTTAFAQWHLCGPESKSILESALGSELPEWQAFQNGERPFGGRATANIRRRDRFGRLGFDIVARAEWRTEIQERLLAAGVVLGSADEREILRVEAGVPVYGKDFDETRFVMELADAASAVSYSKGCYLGQEPIVMSRDRAGHAPRSMVRLRSLQPLTPGEKIFVSSEEIGWVTSAALAPQLGFIGIGIVKWKFREPGSEFDAGIAVRQ